MTTSTTENKQTALATAAGPEKPEATKKAHAAERKRHGAPEKAKSRKKTTSTKKGTQAPKKATTGKAEGARQGSKTAKVLDLLKRSGGTSLQELMKATGWQPHSVRGFISGTLRKKMGLKVKSAKGADGERVYNLDK